MAEARRSADGDQTAWLLQNLPAAMWAPDKLPAGAALNPFRDPRPDSELMRAHRAKWAARRFRVLAGG